MIGLLLSERETEAAQREAEGADDDHRTAAAKPGPDAIAIPTGPRLGDESKKGIHREDHRDHERVLGEAVNRVWEDVVGRGLGDAGRAIEQRDPDDVGLPEVGGDLLAVSDGIERGGGGRGGVSGHGNESRGARGCSRRGRGEGRPKIVGHEVVGTWFGNENKKAPGSADDCPAREAV